MELDVSSTNISSSSYPFSVTFCFLFYPIKQGGRKVCAWPTLVETRNGRSLLSTSSRRCAMKRAKQGMSQRRELGMFSFLCWFQLASLQVQISASSGKIKNHESQDLSIGHTYNYTMAWHRRFTGVIVGFAFFSNSIKRSWVGRIVDDATTVLQQGHPACSMTLSQHNEIRWTSQSQHITSVWFRSIPELWIAWQHHTGTCRDRT